MPEAEAAAAAAAAAAVEGHDESEEEDLKTPDHSDDEPEEMDADGGTAPRKKSDFLSLLESHDEEMAAKEAAAVEVRGGGYEQKAGFLTRTARRLLSKRQRKNRYHDDNFDLDLTYITPRIIAMSFPASGMEATYRNNCADVAAFLHEKHGENFMIINVAEKSYPGDGLNNQVLDFGWPDHMAPPMDRLCGCVQAMDGWNRSDPKNVVVVHCKGGKGRTGCVIAAYMLQSRVFDKPEQAMYHFAMKRFQSKDPSKTGITGQGQRRYVRWFKDVIEGKREVRDQPMFLEAVVMRGVPNFDGHGGCKPLLRLFEFPAGSTQAKQTLEWPTDLDFVAKTEWTRQDSEIRIEVNRLLDRGDILARCYHRAGKSGKKKQKMWRLQFHTMMMAEGQYKITFRTDELDDAKHFPPHCTLTFVFDKIRTPEDTNVGMNYGAALARGYQTAEVDVSHAAAVMFDHARSAQSRNGSADTKTDRTDAEHPQRDSTLGIKASDLIHMTDEDRIKVMMMVKSGTMTIDDAIDFVMKEEGLKPSNGKEGVEMKEGSEMTNPFAAMAAGQPQKEETDPFAPSQAVQSPGTPDPFALTPSKRQPVRPPPPSGTRRASSSETSSVASYNPFAEVSSNAPPPDHRPNTKHARSVSDVSGANPFESVLIEVDKRDKDDEDVGVPGGADGPAVESQVNQTGSSEEESNPFSKRDQSNPFAA